MQPSPKVHQELSRAKADVAAMREASSFDEFEQRWKDFLHRLDRVWNKVKAHFERHPRWHSWSGQYTRLRSEDPLLCYLVQARNADEHTVAELVEHVRGSITIGASEDGSVHLRSMKMVGGKLYIEHEGPRPKVVVTPSRAGLLPVTVRGQTFAVPTVHQGSTIDPNDVIAAAAAGLEFYESFVRDAEQYFAR